MTLAQHRKEIARWRQRARRAKVRLNKFTFALKLEGIEANTWRVSFDQSQTYWPLFWDARLAAQHLQEARDRYTIKKLVERTTRA